MECWEWLPWLPVLIATQHKCPLSLIGSCSCEQRPRPVLLCSRKCAGIHSRPGRQHPHPTPGGAIPSPGDVLWHLLWALGGDIISFGRRVGPISANVSRESVSGERRLWAGCCGAELGRWAYPSTPAVPGGLTAVGVGGEAPAPAPGLWVLGGSCSPAPHGPSGKRKQRKQ